MIRDKKYLFYNSSLNYDNIKITSNEIRVVNSNNIYSVEGDLSNNMSNINLNKYYKIVPEAKKLSKCYLIDTKCITLNEIDEKIKQIIIQYNIY